MINTWIEQLFGVAPDNGNGMLEASLAAIGLMLLFALGLRFLARRKKLQYV